MSRYSDLGHFTMYLDMDSSAKATTVEGPLKIVVDPYIRSSTLHAGFLALLHYCFRQGLLFEYEGTSPENPYPSNPNPMIKSISLWWSWKLLEALGAAQVLV
jgi:hypothetical protein